MLERLQSELKATPLVKRQLGVFAFQASEQIRVSFPSAGDDVPFLILSRKKRGPQVAPFKFVNCDFKSDRRISLKTTHRKVYSQHKLKREFAENLAKQFGFVGCNNFTDMTINPCAWGEY